MSPKKLIITISTLFLLLLCTTWLGGAAKRQSDLSTDQVEASSVEHRADASDSVRFLFDRATAMEQAALESKPVLFFFSLPGSSSSQTMLHTTFENKEIKRLSKQFVCVFIDAVADSRICKQYLVESFPTILILNPQGSELQRLSGKQTTEQLSLQMHVVIQSMAAQLGSAVRK